VGQRATGRI